MGDFASVNEAKHYLKVEKGKYMKNNKHLIAFVLLFAFVMQIFAMPIAGAEQMEDNSAGSVMYDGTYSSGSSVASIAPNAYGPAEIEDGAVYALQNIGTGLWASTAKTAATVGTYNLFQNTSWTNDAQTFKFVKVEGETDTYIIYPLEYGKNNQAQQRALYCDYHASASSNLNVYPRQYSETLSEGFEWTVIQQDGYVHSIHLKADTDYKLYVRGTTSGSESATDVMDVGNIIVRKSTSASIGTQMKWNFVYVVPDGEYYVKNRGTEQFLHGSFDVEMQDFTGNDIQKWVVDHVQDGRYNLYKYDRSTLVYLSNSSEGGDVYLSSNNYQPSSQWYMERLEGGTIKIESVWTNSLNYDYALQPQSETNRSVKNKAYAADTNRIDEWYFMPTDGKYGFQTVYEGVAMDSFDFATHGGGMYLVPENSVVSNCAANMNADSPIIGIDTDTMNQICYEAKTDFLLSYQFQSISIQEDTMYKENGDNVTLEANQYRIAMRVGARIENVYDVNSGAYHNVVFYDLLFLYQLYDGSWVYMVNNAYNVYMIGHLSLETELSGLPIHGYNVTTSYEYNDIVYSMDIYSYYVPCAYFIITT